MPPLTRPKAQEVILKGIKPLAKEIHGLSHVTGRVLRESVKTDRPIPPFNRSMMDGYAVRAVELQGGPRDLPCIGTIPAGTEYKGSLPRGGCIKIMTGAPLPKGADAVVKVEDTTVLEDDRVRLAPEHIEKGQFVHKKGADGRKGVKVMNAGWVITPRDAAAMASLGHTEVLVTELLKLSLLNTGREVVPPDHTPEPYEIRNANGPGLMALVSSFPWIKPRFHGIAPDTKAGLTKRLKTAMKDCHVLVVTGGVSRGDYDFVPEVLQELGVKEVFHRVAMRPGRPIWFGRGPKGMLVFGVPGNPVSNFVSAQQYILPALRARAGISDPLPPALNLPLAHGWEKKAGMEFAVAARLSYGDYGETEVALIPSQGSGDFLAILNADGLAMLPAQAEELEAGEIVEFQPW